MKIFEIEGNMAECNLNFWFSLFMLLLMHEIVHGKNDTSFPKSKLHNNIKRRKLHLIFGFYLFFLFCHYFIVMRDNAIVWSETYCRGFFACLNLITYMSFFRVVVMNVFMTVCPCLNVSNCHCANILM